MGTQQLFANHESGYNALHDGYCIEYSEKDT